MRWQFGLNGGQSRIKYITHIYMHTLLSNRIVQLLLYHYRLPLFVYRIHLFLYCDHARLSLLSPWPTLLSKGPTTVVSHAPFDPAQHSPNENIPSREICCFWSKEHFGLATSVENASLSWHFLRPSVEIVNLGRPCRR